MEKVEASIRGWPLATYDNKGDVDANFKKMLDYALQKEHTGAVKIGVGSHNLFDIAYALVLAEERGVADAVTFEMLEGMGEPVRRVMQKMGKNLLLYCPVAKVGEFQNAVAYLIRRLDENTGPENFLRVAFDLIPGTLAWKKQVKQFEESMRNVDNCPKRGKRVISLNEPDTDWSVFSNAEWGRKLIEEWKEKKISPIPLVIDGKEILNDPQGIGIDPSRPSEMSYQYQMAGPDDVNRCLEAAYPSARHYAFAEKLREGRGELMGAMLRDVGKTLQESDPEVSEAIDFAEYYKRSFEEMSGINFMPKGIVFIASPGIFPLPYLLVGL